MKYIKKIGKYLKNNLILFFLIIFLTCFFILSFYVYQHPFLVFVKEWAFFFAPCFFLICYFIFFCCYIFYEKIKVRKKWIHKKNNELKQLYQNNKKDDFVNYDNAIKKIDSNINVLFNHQENLKNTTNILLVTGEYGSSKIFIIANFLQKIKEKAYPINIKKRN